MHPWLLWLIIMVLLVALLSLVFALGTAMRHIQSENESYERILRQIGEKCSGKIDKGP